MNTDIRLTRYTLPRDGIADLTFEGTVLAIENTNTKKPRYTELRVYICKNKRYICQTLGRSNIPGEIDRSKVYVVDTLEEIPRVFGFSRVAKKIYRSLGLETAEQI